ncbi:MerR family transcriptional regulator [Streptomyces sp. NPDC058653]|uniref:MerR family transcriptional regulator n=1 Tax=Streptomyces sp. NPDC058653 TaxID=3346576 RepID=UPI00365A76CD
MSGPLLPDVPRDIPPDGLSIGETAALTGLAVETLRYYEREGLLLDPAPRDSGGRRRYRANDIAWIAGLVMLRETGMPIADMRVMADLSRRPGTDAERLEFLERHRERVVEAMARTRQHLYAIDQKIDAYRRAANPDANPAAKQASEEGERRNGNDDEDHGAR